MHLKLQIPVTKRKMTLNEAYSNHYRVKMSWKNHWKKSVLRAKDQIQQLDPNKRYDVVARYNFDKRLPDSGNCSPMTKMIVDILVKDYQVIPDDKPKYLRIEANESVLDGPKDNTLDLYFVEVLNDSTCVDEVLSISVPKV